MITSTYRKEMLNNAIITEGDLMSKTGKAICQYCNRPTPDEDLVRWMCSMCRALHGYIREPDERRAALKRLRSALKEEIAWLTKRIAKTQNQTASKGRDSCLKDYRVFLAGKQS